MTGLGDHARRTRLLHRARHFAMPLPDAVMALIFGGMAVFGSRVPFPGLADDLMFCIFVEGGFLFMQAALVDVATRLRKRPPIWAIPIIGVTLLLFTGGMDVFRMAAERGGAVLVPLLFSVAERFAILWSMPSRPELEKIAARALVSNRINAVFIAMVLLLVSNFLIAGAFYFAVAAFDIVRVRGARFAARPTVLFRFDPIHIQYLDPV